MVARWAHNPKVVSSSLASATFRGVNRYDKAFCSFSFIRKRHAGYGFFGNGRVGRLVMFKECLANGQVPFIVADELKLFYYRGLNEWGCINGHLTDTCLMAQDHYKVSLDYFRIKYYLEKRPQKYPILKALSLIG